MGLRIVHGGIGSGRTRRCFEEIRAHAESHPSRRALLVVPDPLKLDAESYLMQALGRDALMMAEVLGFRRLSERLMGEVGGLAARHADAAGRAMAIHRVLKARGDRLSVFGPMADRPGFVPRIETVLSEFRRYGVRPEDLERTASREGPEGASSFRGKARDLALILRDYEASLERLGLLDPAGDLDRLAAILRSAATEDAWPFDRVAWLREASVWIDGFGERRDFTPQETRVIEALAELCREVTVTVCADLVPSDARTCDDGPDALAIGRRTAFRLRRRLAPHLARGGIVALDAPGRGRRPELLHLHRSLERGLRVPFDGPADRVVLLEAGDAYAEAAWIAAEIHRLVHREGYRFKDVAVAACDFEASAPLLEAAFEACGVAAFLDREVRLTGSALPRFVLSLLVIATSSWSLESVMACLRTGLAGIAPEDADRLENHFLARGIRGRSRIFDDRRYAIGFDADPSALADDEDAEGDGEGDGEPGPSASSEGEAVRVLRDRWLRPLADALDAVSGASTCAGRCVALVRFLSDCGMHGRVYRLAAELRAKGSSDGAMRLVKSWNALCGVLRQMEAVAGDEPMPLDDFAALLSAGIDASRAGTIPASPDAVTAGPPDRAIARRPAVLFVVGASADAWPQRGVSEGLLSAADRERLLEEGGIELPSGVADKPLEDAFREYALLSVPTERLYVGYAATDRKGLAVEPSAMVGRIASLLPGCRRALAGPLRDAPADDPRRLAPARANAAEPAAEAPRAPASREGRVVRIPAALVLQAYSGAPSMSVSQLEAYASCAYSHLCKHVLSLKEREVWRPEPAGAGTLAHGVVELAMVSLEALLSQAARDGRAADDVLRDYLASDLDGEVDRLLRETAQRERLGMFFDDGFRASAGRKVRLTAVASLRAAASQLVGDPFLPSRLEWAFGASSGNALAVPLADGTPVRFQGRVDRVDAARDGDGNRFRVVDYKTGDKKVDYVGLLEGLAFQLPAYLSAYRAEDPSRIPDDAAYFYLHVPRHRRSNAAKAASDAGLEKADAKAFGLRRLGLPPERLDDALRYVVLRMEERCGELFGGRFDVSPVSSDSKSPCSYCPFRGVCRKAGAGRSCRILPPLPAGPGKPRDRFAAAVASRLAQDGEERP